MLHFRKLKISFVAALTLDSILTSCHSIDEVIPTNSSQTKSARIQAVALTEGFEVGSTSPKTAYDVAPAGSSSGDNVTLQAKSWNLYDGLIANSTSDKKSGTWSARVRNTGKITMLFDQTIGISTVTVKHATYGTDVASTWGLWYSINGGSTWTQSGSNITTTSTLQTQTFTLTLTGTVRLEIRKATGGTNRINIDDIIINGNGGSKKLKVPCCEG